MGLTEIEREEIIDASADVHHYLDTAGHTNVMVSTYGLRKLLPRFMAMNKKKIGSDLKSAYRNPEGCKDKKEIYKIIEGETIFEDEKESPKVGGIDNVVEALSTKKKVPMGWLLLLNMQYPVLNKHITLLVDEGIKQDGIVLNPEAQERFDLLRAYAGIEDTVNLVQQNSPIL